MVLGRYCIHYTYYMYNLKKKILFSFSRVVKVSGAKYYRIWYINVETQVKIFKKNWTETVVWWRVHGLQQLQLMVWHICGNPAVGDIHVRTLGMGCSRLTLLVIHSKSLDLSFDCADYNGFFSLTAALFCMPAREYILALRCIEECEHMEEGK